MPRLDESFAAHYGRAFDMHGPTPEGVDWRGEAATRLRYDQMLRVLDDPIPTDAQPPSLLDVGCGYGGLLLHAREKGVAIDYTGIDLVEEMIDWANGNVENGRFLSGNIVDFSNISYDYVVCNGIFTQKLNASIPEMEYYCQNIIKKMFSMCRRGIAFNMMRTKVNFMVPNLYYKNPIEILAYCQNNLSSLFRIDHAYPLYEYTIHVYREP